MKPSHASDSLEARQRRIRELEQANARLRAVADAATARAAMLKDALRRSYRFGVGSRAR